MRRAQLHDEDGASMVEYGFLLAGIAIVVALALPVFADEVKALFAGPLSFLGL